MKLIRMIFLFAFLFQQSTLLYCYLDVGSDPSKIKVIEIQELNIASAYEFKEWSPDGDFMIFSNKDRMSGTLTTFILSKSGETVCSVSGYFLCWSLDSKNMIVEEGYVPKDNLRYYHFILNSKEKKQILSGTQLSPGNRVWCFDPDDNKVVFNQNNEVYKLNIQSGEIIKIFSTQNRIKEHIFACGNGKYVYDELGTSERKKINLETQVTTVMIKNGCLDRKLCTKNKNTFISYLINEYIGFYKIDSNECFLFNIKIHGSQQYGSVRCLLSEYYSLSPNGKLVAFTDGENVDELEDLSSGDIVLFNFKKEKSYLTNTDDKIEVVKGWNPQGDSILVFEYKSQKFYIYKLSQI